MNKVPSSADLRRAASIREKIDELERELTSLLGGGGSRSSAGRKSASASEEEGATGSKTARKRGGRRKMSPEARARIAAAQRARWARQKGGSQ